MCAHQIRVFIAEPQFSLPVPCAAVHALFDADPPLSQLRYISLQLNSADSARVLALVVSLAPVELHEVMLSAVSLEQAVASTPPDKRARVADRAAKSPGLLHVTLWHSPAPLCPLLSQLARLRVGEARATKAALDTTVGDSERGCEIALNSVRPRVGFRLERLMYLLPSAANGNRALAAVGVRLLWLERSLPASVRRVDDVARCEQNDGAAAAEVLREPLLLRSGFGDSGGSAACGIGACAGSVYEIIPVPERARESGPREMELRLSNDFLHITLFTGEGVAPVESNSLPYWAANKPDYAVRTVLIPCDDTAVFCAPIENHYK